MLKFEISIFGDLQNSPVGANCEIPKYKIPQNIEKQAIRAYLRRKERRRYERILLLLDCMLSILLAVVIVLVYLYFTRF